MFEKQVVRIFQCTYCDSECMLSIVEKENAHIELPNPTCWMTGDPVEWVELKKWCKSVKEAKK